MSALFYPRPSAPIRVQKSFSPRSRIIPHMTATAAHAHRRELLWFFAIAFVVLAFGIGLRAPWPADEPRFVLVAKQMWESGEWLFPHRGQELYPDKPPLYFWLLGAAYALVRDWNLAFLLPSLLAALGTLALTYDLGRRLWSPRAGLWAALGVLVCAQFIHQAKRAQIDPTVTFFITLGVYGLLRHTLLGPQWRWYWLGCFAAGLGVISKGVGFLALLLLLPYGVMRARRWPGLAPLGSGNGGRWALGALAFLGAIALWLVPMATTALASDNPEHRAYLHEILFRQTATRYTDAWIHHQPAWYFLEVIALRWLPFSLALPWLLPRWREALRAREARVWLPLAWALLVVGFFSLSPGKRDMYILPTLPMVALAAAPYLAGIAARPWFRRVLAGLFALLAVVLLAAGAAALGGEPGFESRIEAARGLAPSDDALWQWLLAVGAAMLLAQVVLYRHALAGAAAAYGLLIVLLYGGVSLLLDDENSARAVMQRARALAGPRTELGLVAWKEQNLLQAVGPVAEFGFLRPFPEQLAAGIAWLRQAPEHRRLFVLEEALGECVLRARAQEVGTANRRTWFLVGPEAIAPACWRAATAP